MFTENVAAFRKGLGAARTCRGTRSLLLAIYFHELGHSVPAWAEGIIAIPTPAKEYIMEVIPADLQQQVSLGGIIASLLFTVLAVVFMP